MAAYIPAVRAARAQGSDERSAAARLGDAVLELASHVPASREVPVAGPHAHARAIAAAAANRAALAAGTLALPPGPFGWLTIVPELVAIWSIQRQMVADIAAVFGASAGLTRSHMLYCLFRHAAAQAVRDVGVRVGSRLLVRELPLHAIERIAARIGVHVSKRVAGRGIARWMPMVGAVGVGAYAYYDTRQVARTAIDLFADGDPRM